MRFYLEDKKKGLRVSGVPEASKSSLALISRTNIKTFEILPIQANFRTSGSLTLQTGLQQNTDCPKVKITVEINHKDIEGYMTGERQSAVVVTEGY